MTLEDASIIILFKEMNYKAKSTSKLCESPETLCSLSFETDNLESVLVKANLQKENVEKGSKTVIE